MSQTNAASDAEAAGPDDQLADAFGPVSLTSFAMSPSGAHLFRAQHAQLTRLMDGIVRLSERAMTTEDALSARSALTSLTIRLPLHQHLEDGLLHGALASEPRSRTLVEQFEREMAPLKAELMALSRAYASASSLLTAPKGEFAHACSQVFTRLQERFQREERDLFPLYDRAVRGVPAAVASPA